MFRRRSANIASEKTWMPCPKLEIKHPGLVYFSPLDQLIVVKKPDAYHEIIGAKDKTPFIVYNQKGEKIYIGTRASKSIDKTIDIKVFNVFGNQVIQVDGPEKRASIWAPADHLVGTLYKPSPCDCNECAFIDEKGTVMKIVEVKGFEKTYNNHKVTNIDTHDILLEDWDYIGTLTRKCEILNVSIDNFSVTFPLEMEVQTKAALLGACLVIWT
ncbi:hypothetical protein NE865_07575 [Phthorimaea operculella]|nr:hypothetical protein NE865_07575 [Phthorimaea operculella]